MRRLIGWWRLLFGFCPECNSSPPNPKCLVCFGSYSYGANLKPVTKQAWKIRFYNKER